MARSWCNCRLKGELSNIICTAILRLSRKWSYLTIVSSLGDGSLLVISSLSSSQIEKVFWGSEIVRCARVSDCGLGHQDSLSGQKRRGCPTKPWLSSANCAPCLAAPNRLPNQIWLGPPSLEVNDGPRGSCSLQTESSQQHQSV